MIVPPQNRIIRMDSDNKLNFKIGQKKSAAILIEMVF